MIKVLKKPSGAWSKIEKEALIKAGVDIQALPPPNSNKLVVLNEPSGGRTFQEILGHGNFEVSETIE